jgi:NAD(P)-dependent dehydrogenase (short-subunit alcohol dehydrogenase family)
LDFDLASHDAIRKAAASLTDSGDKFDVVINSAGVMASPYAVTAEGIESQFGINHVGEFVVNQSRSCI